MIPGTSIHRKVAGVRAAATAFAAIAARDGTRFRRLRHANYGLAARIFRRLQRRFIAEYANICWHMPTMHDGYENDSRGVWSAGAERNGRARGPANACAKGVLSEQEVA
jgi:hypothetical protein